MTPVAPIKAPSPVLEQNIKASSKISVDLTAEA
jgi:hypothetical protein